LEYHFAKSFASSKLRVYYLKNTLGQVRLSQNLPCFEAEMIFLDSKQQKMKSIVDVLKL